MPFIFLTTIILLLNFSRFTFATLIQEHELQNVVTWDNSSIMVRGERLMFLSAEFHPWRLPSPGLWLDVFQKVKALGFSGVSFYLNWALLEGEPGHVRTDGVFALDQFFTSAKEAGIYLWARPGPYINSEVSGGGLPGWLQRNKAQLRSTDPEFLNATKTYISHVGKSISDAQITNGGPVILFQPDNEYSLCAGFSGIDGISNCLDKQYMEAIQDEYRHANITVPMHSNDALPLGNFRPGSGVGEVDIYGFDFYPLSWGQEPCSNSSNWNRGGIPPSLYPSLVCNISLPTSPRSIVEFQGGSPDKWGGVGVNECAALINEEFERVFYKINYALKITLMNIYMTFGGTNWGNLGHSEGYTSYDVGAAIAEDRTVAREKYAELKLQANFFRVSPSYLTALPQIDSAGIYTNTKQIVTTPLLASSTAYYVVRHSDIQTFESTNYQLRVPTKQGNVTVPQLGGSLTLSGRDSKIHVTNYDVDGLDLIYSSAEIFTWTHHGPKRILILYGGNGEVHEFALPACIPEPKITSTSVEYKRNARMQIVRWTVQEERTILSFGDELDVYLLWRNEAYRYWTLELPAPAPLDLYPSPSRHGKNATAGSVLVKAGYLLRNASISDHTLHLSGDINCTTNLEVVSAPTPLTSITFNGKLINTIVNNVGNLESVLTFKLPNFTLPDLASQPWSYHTSLPEILPDYDDSSWKICNMSHSNNPRNLTTPYSLYAGDYGYHAGSFLYRGHFTAEHVDTNCSVTTQGGLAYGHSVWLNEKHVGSFIGEAETTNHTQSFGLHTTPGEKYVITILIDHMGLDLNFYANTESMKNPRGILEFSIEGHSKEAIQWKMTGNLGGEQYIDKSRGPLNEGSMYAERQGWHLPGSPTNGTDWSITSPLEGIPSTGVGFFSTTFDLDMPTGYDIPLKIQIGDAHSFNTTGNFRVQIFINGWQFGKYISNLGPQYSFPVPEGIIDHHGPNLLAITLWAQDANGAKLPKIALTYEDIVQSGYSKPKVVEGEVWKRRAVAY